MFAYTVLNGRRAAAMSTRRPKRTGHLRSRSPHENGRARVATVANATSHPISIIGDTSEAPVVPLDVDAFGQSGAVPDRCAAGGMDSDHIVEAAFLAFYRDGAA